MKKRIMNFVLALTLVVAGTVGSSAYALANETAKEWMTFTYKGGSDVDFTSQVAEGFTPFSDVMPGDTITYKINYANGTSKAADFYMNAEVVKSLEKASQDVGGAYSYVIKNNDAELFSSETVGGDATEKLGLTQASGDTGVYFSLGEVKAGEKGTVSVSITLDGDSQANVYQDKSAELQFYFKAESETLGNKTIVKENEKVVPVTKTVTESVKRTEKKQVVKTLDNGTTLVQIDDSDVPLAGDTDDITGVNNPVTGDSLLPLVACSIAFLSGLALIVYYIKLRVDKKKEVS